MMGLYDGEKCTACSRVFIPADNVVTCPECGSPLHRECWEENGGCANQNIHSEGYAYKRQNNVEIKEEKENIKCAFCGHQNDASFLRCANCGANLRGEDENGGEGQMFEPENTAFGIPGMIPPHIMQQIEETSREQIDEIPAGEVMGAVMSNSYYYVPRFIKMEKEHKKLSWNWSAFLFTSYWLFYRKCYIQGIIVFIIEFILSLFTNLYIYNQFGTFDIFTAVNEFAQSGNVFSYTPFILILLLDLCIGLFLGFFGNQIYKRSIIKKIKTIKSGGFDPERYGYEIRRNGGVSFYAVMLLLFINNFFAPYLIEWIINNILLK